METIKELLIRHEGREHSVYLCPAKARTIGIGWNIDANSLPPKIAAHLSKYGEITDAMIDELFEVSLRWTLADCHALFPNFDDFSERRRLALTDWVFQLGYRKICKFRKSINLINSKQWEKASEEMLRSDWAVEDTPERAQEITQLIEEG